MTRYPDGSRFVESESVTQALRNARDLAALRRAQRNDPETIPPTDPTGFLAGR